MLTRVEDYGDTMLVVGDNICATIDKTDGSIAVEEATENLAWLGVAPLNCLSIEYIEDVKGWKKYGIGGVWTGGSYPFFFIIGQALLKKNKSYSAQAEIYTNVLHKFKYFNNIVLTNDPNMTGVRKSSIKNNKRLYEDFIYTLDTTQPVYIYANPLPNQNFNPKKDFIFVRNFQIEEKACCTSFVKNNRSSGKVQFKIDKLKQKTFFCFKAQLDYRVQESIKKIVSINDIAIFWGYGNDMYIKDTRYQLAGLGTSIDTKKEIYYFILINTNSKKIYCYSVNSNICQKNELGYSNIIELDFLDKIEKIEFFSETGINKKYSELMAGDYLLSPFANPDGTPNEAYIQKVANSKGFLPKGGLPSWIPEV